MTIRFELRTTKKIKGAEMVPLHISVSDGRAFRQRQVTNIMVNPEHWDVKAGDLKKRVLINTIASSHMARRTFIGNIYKLVKALYLVSALTGHIERSRAFSRYRTIDIDMKMDLVKILEGAR